MDKLVLIPRFIDRTGRTVYDIHEDNPSKRVISPGAFIGQIRVNLEDDQTLIKLELVGGNGSEEG